MQRWCWALLLVAGLIGSITPCSAQLMNSPWPSFRHDATHTGRGTDAGPDAATLAWSRPVGAGTSSPAVAVDAVYVFAGGNLSAFTITGELLWSYSCGAAGRSSPAVAASGVVYLTSGLYLYAINGDGTLRWKKTLPGASDVSPTVGPDGSVYVGCSTGKFHAYSAEGALRFTYTAGGAILSSAAVAPDGTVYFGCNNGCLYAIKQDGTLKWKFTTNPVGAIQSSPAVGTDGTVYFGSSGGFLFAVSPAGTQKWRYGGGVVTSSPALGADGTIYFGSQDRSIYALSKVGALKWKYATRGAVNSSATVDCDGTIYCGSDDGSVYALNADGSKLWEFAAGAAVGSSPAIGGDMSIYVLAYNGSLLKLGSDVTPPTTPVVTDDGEYATSATALHAVWGAFDAESGVSNYCYAIGTSPGAEDVVPFTDAGVAAELTCTGLALGNGGRYYFSVRATNRCGLISDVGVSDGITVDITPPDTALTIVAAASSSVQFRIDAADSESAVAQAQYAALYSTDVSSAGWTDCQAGSIVTAPGPFDLTQKLYIAARVRNGAGLWSTAVLREIILDTTPPTTPVVTDDGVYTSDPTTLHAAWAAQDPESGVAGYSCCLGTAPGRADLISWFETSASGVTLTGATVSGLSFISGNTLFFSVKATNGIGLVSAVGSSDGITVDITPPEPPAVTDDGEFTSSADSLHAVFSSSDLHSGVAEYTYCVGASPGACDVRGWTSAGSSQSATIPGLDLAPGVLYYISAKARNGAGLWSTVGTSDGIQYHPQASVWPKFHADLSNTGRSAVQACGSGRLNWRIQTAGYVESSAAFAGDGTAYIGSADGRVYAISPSGSERWSYQTGAAVDSSPAIGTRGEIYVGSCDRYLYCLQPSGTLLWRFAANGMVWSSASVDAGGTIYFGCQDGYLYAVKPDGTLKWKYNAGSSVWSSPALGADGTVYFGCGNGKLYAVTAAGTLRWTYQTGTAVDSSPTIASDGTIYSGSGDGYFYALNSNGSLKWRAYVGNLVDSTAALGADGTIYVGTGGAGTSGTLRAFSPSGVQLWSYSVPGGVRSSPCIDARGSVYFGSADGGLHALRPDGSVIWSSVCGLSVLSSPSIGPRGEILVGSDDGGIYCFKDYPQDTTPPTTPVVTPLQLYVPLGSPVSCRWTAGDEETGIAGYTYAIGSAPGASDLVNWTSLDHATTMSRSDLALTTGQCCYVSVKARNHAGLSSLAGVSAAIRIVAADEDLFIGDAKKRPEGTRVYLPGKVVTAVFADSVFIEEPNRSAGIRCLAAASDLEAGMLVDALGKVSGQNGETVLIEATLTKLNLGHAGAIAPLAISGRSMCRRGLDVTGLLVRVSGRVTRSGAYYFVLSDGFAVTSPRGVQGIEVRAGAGDIPPVGACATITGVISRDIVNGISTMVIRAASDPHLSIH